MLPVTIARPAAGTWGLAGSTGPTRSRDIGIAISDANGTTSSPAIRSALTWSGPTSLTVPITTPPEPVQGFWSLPRSDTIWRIVSAIRCGSRSLCSRMAAKLVASMASIWTESSAS